MKLYAYINLSFKTILRNKMRSFLSILGIVFGVATLVATIAIAEGTKRSILKAVESLGTNLVVVSAKPLAKERSLNLNDLETLHQFAKTVKKTTPVIIRPSSISHHEKTKPISLIGVSENYPDIRKHPVKKGRFINQEDLKNITKVCLLGEDLERELFKHQNSVGKMINIGEGTFLIIGVMKQKEKSFFSSYQKNVFIPVTTMQEFMSLGEEISQILIESQNSHTVYLTIKEVSQILTNLHNNHKIFDIWCQEDLLKQQKRVTKIFKIALGSIAIISLIIGGIGIMNILLASVNERIKEIGIRKAVGASSHSIMLQFIFESLILSCVGGITGVVSGIFMGEKIAEILTKLIPYEGPRWQAIVTFDSIQIAILFSLLIGFFFGLYPARKASKLDPCEALNYE